MYLKHQVGCATVLLMLFFTGCQHIPRETLQPEATLAALHHRDLDIEPIHAYAQKLGAPEASAHPFTLSDGISLSEARAVTLWYNPAARMARQAVESARSLSEVSGLLPDPEVGFGVGRKHVDSAEGPVARDWISSSGLSITLPISGRLKAERQWRGTQYNVAVLAAREAEWQALIALQEAWWGWSAQTERVALLEAHATRLESLARQTKMLAEAGELPAATAGLFEVEHGRRQAELLKGEFDVAAARTRVLAVMGLLADAPVELIPSLTCPVPPDAEEVGVAGSHPHLATLREQYAASERRLRFELRKQYPDITLSPIYTDESDETSLSLNLGIPVPVWNANQAGIAEAVAERAAARLRFEHDYHGLLVALAQHEAARDGAMALWAHLMKEAAPALDRHLESTDALLRVGEVDVVVLHSLLVQSFDLKLAILEARRDQCIAALHIFAATQPDAFLPETAKEITP